MRFFTDHAWPKMTAACAAPSDATADETGTRRGGGPERPAHAARKSGPGVEAELELGVEPGVDPEIELEPEPEVDGARNSRRSRK